MRLVFFGTPHFATASLEALLDSRHEVALVVAQPDRPAGRGMRMQKPPVAELALARSIPLVQPAKIRSPEFLDSIREASPDAGVVVAYGRILPQALLDIPSRGFLNVHGSLLPHYRGAAPIQRAIERGETSTGVTIMQLDADLDHGPWFAMEEIPIAPDERTPDLAARLAVAGARLLVETIDAIERGDAVATGQDHSRATFAPRIEKDEGRIRWSDTAKSIYDRFRAFDPWPGIFARIGGEDVKLIEIAPAAGGGGAPGAMERIEPPSVVISAADGAIRIDRLQRPGKSPVAAADYFRSRGLTPGTDAGE
jgi:methionyl-tRNA formyltransferase